MFLSAMIALTMPLLCLMPTAPDDQMFTRPTLMILMTWMCQDDSPDMLERQRESSA
jgi:hypothetical protein